MNRLVEQKCVTEMQYGTNFAYILNDNNDFLPTEYKVLQGQADGVFLKCMKMYFNGKIQLFYLTETYVSLLSLISRLNCDSFQAIVANLFSSIIEAKHNGFLSCKNIDISFEHIFIDPSTFRVKLVYIPANNNLYDSVSSFENEIRVGLIKLISGNQNISSGKALYLSSDLQNGSVTLEEIASKLSGTGMENLVSAGTEAPASTGKMTLVAMNVQPRTEIVVDKDEFVIGKKQSAVDGAVSFNKMISRVHCKVLRRQNQYYVEDLQSANGTYVNGARLRPNAAARINNGDIIRLANSDFQVVLS